MIKEESLAKIKVLVDRFSGLSEQDKNQYNEEQTKNVFIRPLFEILGWNFTDANEVRFEGNVSGKRADYEFRLNSITKFYVEAKAIKVDLDLEQHARQAINYAWNTGVDWAVLTDFEGIKVYNAQSESKSLLDRLVFELTFSDYVNKFEKLNLLSKENFLDNKLEEYAIDIGKKLKKMTVNEKLFIDLKIAREEITKTFGQWNPTYSKEDLEEGVQRILDRLVFIRVLEDRGLEKNILKETLNGWVSQGKKDQFFHLLINNFRELDKIYNSSLFKEHFCEKWEEYDGRMWSNVVHSLYGSEMFQYDFKEIPADILGGVYEGYLGYIAKNPIEVDKGGKSGKLLKVEDRKELKEKSRKKRKEQGIYYTPKFIVDYIVKSTLGEKLKEIKTVDELKKLKILDPACGSGSFITNALGAMNEKYKEFNSPGDQTTKTTILLENIYGVDLDAQAIELARLNLLLATLDTKAKLPTPEHIKNGNSLISGTEAELKKYFGDNWRDKKPFAWQEEYTEVFKQGGFDVIIGNPPWGADIDKDTQYLEDQYPNSTKSYKDIYKIFIDKSLSLLKSGGMLGFIVPNTFLYQPRYEDIKKVINQYENFVINLGEKIFHNVQLPSCILIITKQTGANKFIADLTKEERGLLASKIWEAGGGTASAKAVVKDTGVIFNEVFLLKDAGVKHQRVDVGKAEKGKSDLRERIYYKGDLENKNDYALYVGSDLNRYTIHNNPSFVLRNNYKDLLEQDEIVYFDKQMMDAPEKILWRQTADKIRAVIINGEWFANTLQVAVVKDKYNNKVDIHYALAVFNSRYIDYLYHQKVLETGRVFPQVKLKYLRDLPFVIGSKSQQKTVSDLAKKMVELNKQLHSAQENSEKYNYLKTEIEKTDKMIDRKVYELYGLTEEEKKTVES